MSNVNIQMMRRREEQFNSTIIMRFNQYNNSTKFCVVEGYTDLDFYRKTNNVILNDSKLKYLFHNSLKNNEHSICEAIIYAYKCLPKMAKKQNRIVELIYIIDKDYDGISKYRKYLSNIEMDDITVTPCHSHESFFFASGNTKRVFDKLGINNYHYSDFKKQFFSVWPRLKEFCACKAAITRAHDEHKKFKYCKLHNDAEIFQFETDCNNDLCYNAKYFDAELKEMRKVINADAELIKFYKEALTKIKHAKDIKGHVSFGLFEAYVTLVCQKQIRHNINNRREYYKSIIESLLIDMDIKINTIT
jgi:hypothetical protein